MDTTIARREQVALAWWAVLIAVAAALRFALAATVTDFVLVDDAYITLRYARNAVETGSLVYNSGEPVFGVTSPLWGFVSTAVMAAAGRGGVEVAVIALGIALWSWTALRLTGLVAPPYRAIAIIGFLFTPVFVDNQMLGMETPLFVWLAVHAIGAAQEGRLRASAAWAGWLLVARPEGVLFAPALLYAASAARGWRATRDELLRPFQLALLLTPGLLWVAFASLRYGTILPQSMVAKSGWNSAHYDAIGTLENLWFGLARLTFVPFVDYLPNALAHGATAALAVLVGHVILWNVRAGTTASRTWLGVYVTYVGFYIVGKGATEASWYAVPSSVALLLAMQPAVPSWVARSRTICTLLTAGLIACSIVFVVKRAPLLHSYFDGYGACAAALERAEPAGDQRVLIGEIGVFGFASSHHVIDVGALVSPEVLPLKNAGLSLIGMAQATDADWLVISDIALERNFYPSVGDVWSSEEERAWLGSAELVMRARDKRLLRLPHSSVLARRDKNGD